MNYSKLDTISTNSLSTVLLLHTVNNSSHYDWLVTNPLDPNGRLWTARIDYPSATWAKLGQCAIEVIAPHRHKYLNYQGAISDNRGTVKRVDQGQATCKRWQDKQIILDINMTSFLGKAHIYNLSDNNWQVEFTN